MTAIGKGDFVECIDSSGNWPPGEALHEGSLYVVNEVGLDPIDDVTILFLEGMERRIATAFWGYRVGYGLERFRPISGGERGMFDHMLKLDAPNREPVAA